MNRRTRLSLQEYEEGIRNGDRGILSRAITLAESSLPDDQELSATLIENLLPHTGQARRIGITGVPGVGKSTFIESLGMQLVAANHHVAVLTVDPSSTRTKGSILGDKTRMEQLSRQPSTYIRPSATGLTLGGVANATREAMLLCEAAGYDIILVETVGVGQSEISVRNMVDFFLLLMLAGAGDELQGIKKGIMEMADAIAITKADGENILPAKQAKVSYENALHLFQPGIGGWTPKVVTTSALSKEGMTCVWSLIEEYYSSLQSQNLLQALRQEQRRTWFREMLDHMLASVFFRRPGMKDKIAEVEGKVVDGLVTPLAAARQLLDLN
jgi:LAO/AO transport system kinase